MTQIIQPASILRMIMFLTYKKKTIFSIACFIIIAVGSFWGFSLYNEHKSSNSGDDLYKAIYTNVTKEEKIFLLKKVVNSSHNYKYIAMLHLAAMSPEEVVNTGKVTDMESYKKAVKDNNYPLFSDYISNHEAISNDSNNYVELKKDVFYSSGLLIEGIRLINLGNTTEAMGKLKLLVNNPEASEYTKTLVNDLVKIYG